MLWAWLMELGASVGGADCQTPTVITVLLCRTTLPAIRLCKRLCFVSLFFRIFSLGSRSVLSIS